jgi:hypothetical protein
MATVLEFPKIKCACCGEDRRRSELLRCYGCGQHTCGLDGCMSWCSCTPVEHRRTQIAWAMPDGYRLRYYAIICSTHMTVCTD